MTRDVIKNLCSKCGATFHAQQQRPVCRTCETPANDEREQRSRDYWLNCVPSDYLVTSEIASKYLPQLFADFASQEVEREVAAERHRIADELDGVHLISIYEPGTRTAYIERIITKLRETSDGK